MNILITGGAGYIGSHTCVELLNLDHNIIILDNLYNSSKQAIDSIEKITNKKVIFYQSDLRNIDEIDKCFSENKIDAVIHFAGLKAVGESVVKPLDYYENNVYGTINLCKVMQKYDVKKIIFSSTATLYGESTAYPFKETLPRTAINPYGKSKLFIEEILDDLYISDNEWSIISLRYFNPIGAHESGDLGEDPNGIPNNLVPYVSQVAIGKLEKLTVFGNDYPTPDGTCIRDYIHVVDLARGHVAALDKLKSSKGVSIYNLGTGRGTSVMEIINAFEKATGVKVNYVFGKRRLGDAPVGYGDPSKANAELGWKAEYDIEKMMKDTWNWQSKHPNGFNE